MQNCSGTPVNSKSFLAFIFNQMQKLDRGEISNETACAQAKLASQANNVYNYELKREIDAQTACAQAKLISQANNLLNYELKRTIVQLRLKEIGGGTEATQVRLREIESKGFDDTI